MAMALIGIVLFIISLFFLGMLLAAMDDCIGLTKRSAVVISIIFYGTLIAHAVA